MSGAVRDRKKRGFVPRFFYSETTRLQIVFPKCRTELTRMQAASMLNLR